MTCMQCVNLSIASKVLLASVQFIESVVKMTLKLVCFKKNQNV